MAVFTASFTIALFAAQLQAADPLAPPPLLAAPTAFEPKSFALIGQRAERFDVVWDLLPDTTRRTADQEARRRWRDDFTGDERLAVRVAARTLYADLSPEERIALRERRAMLWRDMPPIDRVRARANEGLAFSSLPLAYQNGLRAEALWDIDAAAAEAIFAPPTDPSADPSNGDLLERLGDFDGAADGG